MKLVEVQVTGFRPKIIDCQLDLSCFYRQTSCHFLIETKALIRVLLGCLCLLRHIAQRGQQGLGALGLSRWRIAI